MAAGLQHGLGWVVWRLASRGLAVYLAVCACGTAFAAGPYAGIYQRNVFHLRAPSTSPVQIPTAPLPKILLTGITTILRGKRALLKVELPGKPATKAESYILTEGQKAGPLEVLQINEKTSVVKVDYSGTITNLTFEKLTRAGTAAPPQPGARWRGMTYRTAYR